MPSQPVVSNTSPLINLVGVGQLDLLRQLYTEVWVPDLVINEYRAKLAVGDPDLGAVSWLAIKPVSPDPVLQAYRALGDGEAAAITLAQSHQARLLLLDDKYARQIARRLGLTVVGTLGVLLAAKQSGYLAAIKPLLDMMIAQGRRMSPSLQMDLLRLAGETEEQDAAG